MTTSKKSHEKRRKKYDEDGFSITHNKPPELVA